MRRERQARAGVKSGRLYGESNCCGSQEFLKMNCIQDYHDVYREVWVAGVGGALVCNGEPKSASNRCAVAMKKEETFMGHLLKAVGCVLLFVVENISCD